MANAPRAQTTKAPATISFRGILRRAPWATVPSVLNVNMASLLRSALGWRDIVPGAQTERRGGAGPVRGLLRGKDPTGRFRSGVRNHASGVKHNSTDRVCWPPDSYYNACTTTAGTQRSSSDSTASRLTVARRGAISRPEAWTGVRERQSFIESNKLGIRMGFSFAGWSAV